MFAIITENDESQWDDKTGQLYHFPKRYLRFLPSGTRVIYYKGNLKNRTYKDHRLSDAAHYFATATIGKTYPDADSDKGDYYAEIEDFQRFSKPVLAKYEGSYLEVIPPSRSSNYWRDGVRPIEQQTYENILGASDLSRTDPDRELNDNQQWIEDSFTSYEGNKKSLFRRICG